MLVKTKLGNDPTKKQLDYLLILFHDCGIQTANGRGAWLTHRFQRLIRSADELTDREASDTIRRLKEIRGDKA